MSDHIPFEIQIEITKKLPVKSLIKFRSVSKPWKSLIDSSDFITSYTVSSSNQPHHLLIGYKTLSSEQLYVSIVDDETFPQNKFSPTVPPSVNLLRHSIIIGSSHGLFCFFGYSRKPGDFVFDYSKSEIVVLWNPAIRKSVTIDLPPNVGSHEYAVFGFGVCPVASDPKLVRIDDTSHWQVEVYELSTGVWRSSFGNPPEKLVEFKWPLYHVTINRFIYWFGVVNIAHDTTPGVSVIIISFDLTSEEFGEIYLPDKLALQDPMELFLCNRSDSLAVLKGSCKTNKDVYEVWIMENGVSQSFMRAYSVEIPYRSGYTLTLPMEFRRTGELMVSIVDDTEESAELVVYEPLSKRINDVGIKGLCDSLLVSSYTESLILLDH